MTRAYPIDVPHEPTPAKRAPAAPQHCPAGLGPARFGASFLRALEVVLEVFAPDSTLFAYAQHPKRTPSRKLLHDPNRHSQVVGYVRQGQQAVRGDMRGDTPLTIGGLIDGC